MKQKGASLFYGLLVVAVVAALGWALASKMRTSKTAVVQLTASDSLQSKAPVAKDSVAAPLSDTAAVTDSGRAALLPPSQGSIDTKMVSPQQVVQFAKTLIGTPYVYGSTNPKVGFDCSGFITYVFNHFGVSVPRSSIDFTHVGKEVEVRAARPGDLILFTGTNPAERFVGHMGIVADNSDSLRFIHSTSGKAHGVTITPLSQYYQGRYVKTVRVFPE